MVINIYPFPGGLTYLRVGTAVPTGQETGLLAVTEAVLLPVLLSPVVATLPVNVRVLPTAAFSGVIGTVKVVLAPLARGPGLEQATVEPVVEHVNPLLANVAGAVTLFGIVSVVVIGPVVGIVPILLTLTGIVLV